MLPKFFGLIQCIIGCVIVFKHSQKVVWHRKWVLHPVVAPIRDQKNASKCPQNYHFGDVKINFFLGRGHSPFPRPLPRTPLPRRIAPPPSEILNTPLRRFEVKVQGYRVILLLQVSVRHQGFTQEWNHIERSNLWIANVIGQSILPGMIKPMHKMHHNGRTDAYTLIGLCLEVTWSKSRSRYPSGWSLNCRKGRISCWLPGPHMFVFFYSIWTFICACNASVITGK